MRPWLSHCRRSERGASLIVAIFLIVIVGFFGTMMGSLISMQSFTAMNDVRSTQAFDVAEGGVEFGQRDLALNLDWYRSTVDPIVSPSTTLGSGAFVINTFLPATLLRARIPTAISVNPIRVYTTSNFPAAGYLQIEDSVTGSWEFVQYTGINLDTFIGITRNVAIGGVSGGAFAHGRGNTIYPVTTLSTALATLGSPCVPAPAASFTIAAHTKFLTAGTIDIEGEEISYATSTSSGGLMTLTGVTRCQNLTSSGHPVGIPVTTITVDGVGADYEAHIVSTGTVVAGPVGSAVRVVGKTIQR